MAEEGDSSDGAGPGQRQLGLRLRFRGWRVSWVAQLEGCSEIISASASLQEGHHICLKRRVPHGMRGWAFLSRSGLC